MSPDPGSEGLAPAAHRRTMEIRGRDSSLMILRAGAERLHDWEGTVID